MCIHVCNLYYLIIFISDCYSIIKKNTTINLYIIDFIATFVAECKKQEALRVH